MTPSGAQQQQVGHSKLIIEKLQTFLMILTDA
jgi:hypothetical protein